MRYLFFLSVLLLSLVAKAQTGNYFLQHYSPGDERLDHVCFDIVQDERGIMYFATRAGILRFDGETWDMTNESGAIYSLEINTKGEIFWGGAKGFGKLMTESDGTLGIIMLSNQKTEDVYQALAIRDHVYFLNGDAIFTLDANNKITAISVNDLPGPASALFELYDVPYVSTEQAGSYKVEKNKLVRSSLPVPEKTSINFTARFDDTYLIGTDTHQLFLCSEDLKVRPIKLQDEQYLKAGVVIQGNWLNKHLVALGTLRGGIVFINPFTGKTEEIINYNTGLPDNEVFALMCDRNKNIWAAHDYGFTRISPFLPFRSFSHYNGLQGNLFCAASYKDNVYVGTSLGLFKLSKEEVYEEIVYYVDVKVPIVPEKKPIATQEQPEKQTAPEQKEKKKGFLRFLKKRNKDQSEESEINQQVTEHNKPVELEKPEETFTIKKVKKTEKILRASQFAFKKVKGIDAKVTSLVEVNGKLIAAGLAGVFEVNDLAAVSIVEEPARSIFSYQDNLLVATYSDDVQQFQYNGRKWNRLGLLKNIDDQITFIFKTDTELWLCALDKVYRLQSGDDTDSVRSISFPNPNFSRLIGIQLNNDIVLVSSDGFFRIDQAANTIARIDSLPAPKAYFASSGSLWYHDNHSWNVLGKVTKQTNINLLNIFPDLRFITSGQPAENLWVITSANELYKFYGEKLALDQIQYPLFVKSIRHADRKISSDRKIKINQEEGTVTIEVVKPGFTGARTAEYRYFLKGLDENWSPWSNNNEVSFPYLPNGSYTLLVESRDAFGAAAELAPIEIEVLPPYWRQPWFYAMEFAVIAMLVLVSFRLSSRFRFISRLLSLLTIILLIEFIQTVAGYTFATNSSPVIDFIIQVVIAFLVLPIEGFLRNLMFKSMDSKSRLYQIISGTEKQSRSIKP